MSRVTAEGMKEAQVEQATASWVDRYMEAQKQNYYKVFYIQGVF